VRLRAPWTAVLVPLRYRDAVVGDALEEARRRGGTSRVGTRLWIHGFLIRAAVAAWRQQLSAGWRRPSLSGKRVTTGGLRSDLTSPSGVLRRAPGFAGDVLSDIKYSFRQLRRSPVFAAVAVLSLALGIGANTAIFSVMNAMLLRSLPVTNPEELVEFVHVTPEGGKMTNLHYPVFEHLKDNHDGLSGIFAFYSRSVVFRIQGEARRFTAHTVSGSFFPTLGVNAFLGRSIGPDDDRPGRAAPVVVLSHSFWSRQFGRDPAVLGTTVQVDGKPLTVIGVMPPQFFGVDRARIPDVWIPLSLNPTPPYAWVIGRLKPGIPIPQVRAELEPTFQHALESLGYDRFQLQKLEVNRAAAGTSGLRWIYWEYSNTLKIVLGLTGLMLFIACVNLASLLTARSAARTHEIGVRLAVGAARGRIVRQWITENLLLAILGGGLGLVVATWGHQLLLTFLMSNAPTEPLDFRLDGRLLGMTFVISMATGLVFGLVPAVHAARGNPLSPIKGAAQSGSAPRMPIAKAMLTVQVALSLVLLIGAGLFVRSLRKLSLSDLGFPRANLVLMTVDPSLSPSIRDWPLFWRQMTDRVVSLPDVRSASFAGNVVFGSGGWSKAVWVSGFPKTQVDFNLVGPGFFETVGIPLLTGREFGEQDQANAPSVAVVNEAFVRKFFGDENPLGKRLDDRGPELGGRYEIVGVVADAKNARLRETPYPMVFQALYQAPTDRQLVLHARTVSEPAVVVPVIRREISAVDPDVVVDRATTLADVAAGQLGTDRMFATLAGLFGLLAVSLVSIGLYGLLAYNVERRTHEIGTRIALGARPVDVARPVLREVLLLAAGGVFLGVPAGLAATRLIRSTLFGIEPYDPLALISAAALILVVTLLAAWIPARRATKTDPMVALRYE
jgi:predicted permease